MGKVGRKPNHYITSKGETINGLSLRKKRGRKVFLPTGKDAPEFGTDDDPTTAIHKFRVWEAGQGKTPHPLYFSQEITDDDTAEFASYGLTAKDVAEIAQKRVEVDSERHQWEHEKWKAYYRNLIHSDPRRAAIELDCEPLSLLVNVADLKPLTTATLEELGDCYLRDKQGEILAGSLKNSKQWWEQFCEIVGVESVVDLSHDAFKKYRAEIQRLKGKHENEWVRSRFGKIKAIITHALAELNLSDVDRRRLDYVSLLKLPRKKKTPAVDIQPKEMTAILAHADPWESAIILTALNGAYLPKEIRSLRWDKVDFRKKFIRFDREKAERLTKDAQPVPRCCVLWDRTIAALKNIKADSEIVFISTRGTPVHVYTIVKRFAVLVKKAKVKPRYMNGETIPVTFKHIRKSSLTAASNAPNVPDRQINLLAGHSAGIKDVYVVPRNVVLACEAIESHYFGTPKKSRGKK